MVLIKSASEQKISSWTVWHRPIDPLELHCRCGRTNELDQSYLNGVHVTEGALEPPLLVPFWVRVVRPGRINNSPRICTILQLFQNSSGLSIWGRQVLSQYVIPRRSPRQVHLLMRLPLHCWLESFWANWTWQNYFWHAGNNFPLLLPTLHTPSTHMLEYGVKFHAGSLQLGAILLCKYLTFTKPTQKSFVSAQIPNIPLFLSPHYLQSFPIPFVHPS